MRTVINTDEFGNITSAVYQEWREEEDASGQIALRYVDVKPLKWRVRDGKVEVLLSEPEQDEGSDE